MNTEQTAERAAQIRANMNVDIWTTFKAAGVGTTEDDFIGDVTDAAMFHVEHLLVEIEDLQAQVRLLTAAVAELTP